MSPLMLTVLFNMFGEMLLSNSQGWLLQIKYNILKYIHIEQNRTECLYCHYTVVSANMFIDVTIINRKNMIFLSHIMHKGYLRNSANNFFMYSLVTTPTV